MKDLIHRYYLKYFYFLGVRNEGHKRLLTVIITIFGLVILPILSDDVEFYDYLDYLLDSDYWVFFISCLFVSPIIVGVVVKIYFWVKEGFNK